MKYLTVKQLNQACKENKYLLLRNSDGVLFGVNGGSAKLALKRTRFQMEDNTTWIGFIPCSFDKYITNKIPFLT